MLTQCPSCQTTFRVTSEILRVAHGQVRCGRCQTQFDALERLIEETDDGAIESGRYMRPPRALPQPPPVPGQIDVDEPIEHEDITLEGRHIEISGVYEGIDESGQGQPQIHEEVIEEWVEFDDAENTVDTDLASELAAESEDEVEIEIEPRIEMDSEADVEDEPEIEYEPDGELIDRREEYSSAAEESEDFRAIANEDEDEDEDIRVTAAEMAAERAASRSGRWAQAQFQPQPQSQSQAARSSFVRAPDGTRTRRNPRAIAVDNSPAIDFDFPTQQSSERTSPLWKILVAPLILLLLVQVIHHYRSVLARHPQIGAPLQNVYGALGLSLHPDWNLHAYEVRQWGVIADPAQPGTLKVRASVKNLADFPQPYPLLKLVLEDRWGDQVRAREFDPSEYLDPTAAPDRMLAPAQQSNASIAIVDPGPDAEGFRFDVCLRGARGSVCAADVPGKK